MYAPAKCITCRDTSITSMSRIDPAEVIIMYMMRLMDYNQNDNKIESVNISKEIHELPRHQMGYMQVY